MHDEKKGEEAPEEIKESEVTQGDKLGDGAIQEEDLPGDAGE